MEEGGVEGRLLVGLIPHELWALIFGYVSPFELRHVALVCKAWLKAVKRSAVLVAMLRSPTFDPGHTTSEVVLHTTLDTIIPLPTASMPASTHGVDSIETTVSIHIVTPTTAEVHRHTTDTCNAISMPTAVQRYTITSVAQRPCSPASARKLYPTPEKNSAFVKGVIPHVPTHFLLFTSPGFYMGCLVHSDQDKTANSPIQPGNRPCLATFFDNATLHGYGNYVRSSRYQHKKVIRAGTVVSVQTGPYELATAPDLDLTPVLKVPCSHSSIKNAGVYAIFYIDGVFELIALLEGIDWPTYSGVYLTEENNETVATILAPSHFAQPLTWTEGVVAMKAKTVVTDL
eukprot:TRINITY_DN6232_c0_g1_i1.p1 TRINITY_DN6232_c0_g1~~TRINITY_DN6232_c0_g1_i1.p1  ORF type:complete len:344 (-),score=35.76 TRINITY_DN6232_c0_g1_i1:30-1061(-)